MIADDDAGLSRRLMIERRRIASQHSKLGELWATFLEPLERLDWAHARTCFTHVHEGLLAHFDVEERVQIPALHRGEDARTHDLERLVNDHRAFREGLDSIALLLDTEELETVKARTTDLIAKLNEHEDREEDLFGIG